MLDACRKYGIKRYHQVSTDEVYGDLPLDRPDLFFTEETTLHTSSPYSASKASADLLVLAYFRSFGVPVTISRCSNNYGPYHFPEKLIPLIIINALNNKPLPIYGTGENVRDWLYVEDHCSAIDLIVRSGRVGEVYNIGGHNEKTNLQVVQAILKELGKGEESICYVADRLGHEINAKMVYISTDYVFSGSGQRFYEVDDETGPPNVYGLTKLEGEHIVRSLLTKYFIVRISWVFGYNGNNFVKSMLKLGETHSELNVVADQIGSPTYTADLAALLYDMVVTDKYGIYHAFSLHCFIFYLFFSNSQFSNENYHNFRASSKSCTPQSGSCTTVLP